MCTLYVQNNRFNAKLNDVGGGRGRGGGGVGGGWVDEIPSIKYVIYSGTPSNKNTPEIRTLPSIRTLCIHNSARNYPRNEDTFFTQDTFNL